MNGWDHSLKNWGYGHSLNKRELVWTLGDLRQSLYIALLLASRQYLINFSLIIRDFINAYLHSHFTYRANDKDLKFMLALWKSIK